LKAEGDSAQIRAAAAMVFGSIVSVQLGAAIAAELLDRLGTGGAALLRSGFGALLLLAVTRRSWRAHPDSRFRDVALFGLILAGMNLSFYGAIGRIPLGVAVTLEFTGPLAVAVFGSRRRRDLLWALLAGVGIVLLSSGTSGSGGIDSLGAFLALLAGALWGAYILQSARVGATHPGLGGLARATAIAALLVAPFGVAQAGGALLDPAVLAVGLALGLLSAALPYALELEALRRLPNAVFGVLMSVEPAVGALVGFVVLSQALSAVEAVAVGFVVAASAGVLHSAAVPAPRDG
jgi:inner membrane transporter RhtA